MSPEDLFSNYNALTELVHMRSFVASDPELRSTASLRCAAVITMLATSYLMRQKKIIN